MKNFFRKLEESLLSREVRKSTEKLNILLDDEFLEYGSSGKIYSKKNIIERLPNSEFLPIKISNFQVFKISENFVQTRFVTLEENGTSLRSSLWKKYDKNDWKMIFHQGSSVIE